MNQQELDEIEAKLNIAFRPHSPIDDPSYFFGRDGERQSLRQTAFSSGQHAVVYGEKGSGKTSLARVSVSGLHRLDIFCEKDSDFSHVMRDLVFKMRENGWSNLEFDYQSEAVNVSGTMIPVDRLTGNMVKSLFGDQPVVIVFDEIDRLPETTVHELGEFVKSIATDKGNITIILIGVSSNEEDILRGHGSVFRNTKFIRIEKFSDHNTVRDIVQKGGTVLGIEFSAEAISEITQLSDLYPFYVQLLSVSAARAVLTDDRRIVEKADVVNGAKKAAEEADRSLRDLYDRSILSAKSNIYRDIVWGLAAQDSSIELPIGQVAEVASRLSGEVISPQSAGAAMKKLAEDESSILKSNSLGPKRTFYSFRHPLMKSYVRIKMAMERAN